MIYGLIALAVTLTGLGFYFRKAVLLTGAGLSWALLGFHSLTVSSAANPTEITDIYMALFWMGIIMLIVCIFEAVYAKPKSEAIENAALDGISDREAIEKEYDDMWAETAIPTFRRCRKSKTGRMKKALKRL